MEINGHLLPLLSAAFGSKKIKNFVHLLANPKNAGTENGQIVLRGKSQAPKSCTFADKMGKATPAPKRPLRDVLRSSSGHCALVDALPQRRKRSGGKVPRRKGAAFRRDKKLVTGNLVVPDQRPA